MTEYSPTVSVYAQQFETAVRHGMELWWDGSTPTKRLDQRDGRSGFTRFVNARVEGKLAEVAFKQFLKYDFGVHGRVDWRIYGDYDVTDDGDLRDLKGDDGGWYIPGVEFDVKKTKPWNSWLAIRRQMYEKHPDDAPYILTKLSLEEDLDVDRWEATGSWSDVKNDSEFERRLDNYVAEYFPLDVEIVGTAYKDEFTDFFDKGDKLYDPETGNKLGGPLRRNNAGIHVDDLINTEERWNRVVDEITDDYPITYNEL